MPVGELAVGMSPLSRSAMQIAFSAPPSTGQRAAAHSISRIEKSWIASPSSADEGARPGDARRATASGAGSPCAGAAANSDEADGAARDAGGGDADPPVPSHAHLFRYRDAAARPAGKGGPRRGPRNLAPARRPVDPPTERLFEG